MYVACVATKNIGRGSEWWPKAKAHVYTFTCIDRRASSRNVITLSQWKGKTCIMRQTHLPQETSSTTSACLWSSMAAIRLLHTSVAACVAAKVWPIHFLMDEKCCASSHGKTLLLWMDDLPFTCQHLHIGPQDLRFYICMWLWPHLHVIVTAEVKTMNKFGSTFAPILPTIFKKTYQFWWSRFAPRL